MVLLTVLIEALALIYIQRPRNYAIEAKSDEKDILRIKSAFQSMANELSVLVYDNAVWDHTYQYINELVKKDLSKSYVRIEVICDRQGFWLKPHCDIKEKLISCLLFVNKFNENEDLGTDFYDSNLKKVKTMPYRDNYGYIFSSGPNTWHGMEKKEIVKERRCLQVNYVSFKTDWKVN